MTALPFLVLMRARNPCVRLRFRCTARLDDGSAVLGAHARTKSVRALALQIAGLKGSLHDTPNFCLD
jgi:hypothetical protein